MYRHNQNQLIFPHEFFLPFGGQLNPDNRWCQYAAIIPWAEIETRYAKNFKNLKTGNSAYSVRMAFGTLFIQNLKGLSDRETVEEIAENPYLQYFIGLTGFVQKPPFDPSLMVHFRKRLGKDLINEINELIAKPAVEPDNNDDNKPSGGDGEKTFAASTECENNERENQGKLILDATCTPADIHYPRDLWLLNQVREALEEIIDILHAPLVGICKKPRTYRNRARKDYLIIEKKKHKTSKEVRKAIGKQLRYIRRDIASITNLVKKSQLSLLNKRQYQNLLVSQEIYRQQLEMYTKRTHKIEDRIVSLHMPFIRPVVRGKATADVEFGGKLAISVVNGFCFMERLSFDNFNEGITLIESIENYRQRFGYYPESVIADKIYRNRDNIRYCQKHGIRLSGPPLGRPAKDTSILKEQQKQERQDAGIRNSVEGKFGEGKRFYGLNRIMTRLQETSEAVISMQLLVMNLEKRLRILFVQFFQRYFGLSKLAV